jgi:predicted short-subunit dehydrogenase-like oxidoreductase (DUF2520 family)
MYIFSATPTVKGYFFYLCTTSTKHKQSIMEGAKGDNISIVQIGAGNVGVHLAKALHGQGFRIRQVYSRTEVAARELAAAVEAEYTVSLDEIVADAGLYIVSLTDAALVELIPSLAARKENGLMVHTAGSIPMDVWQGAARRYGVLYPMQTFSKRRAVDFREVPFFIEANSGEDARLLTAVAQRLSGKVFEATSAQRQCLHLAGVFAGNFTNHLYALAAGLLKKQELPFDLLLPLIDETARKVHSLAPLEAQTGPAARGDSGVMSKQLELLAEDPALQHIYELMSESIYNRKQK